MTQKLPMTIFPLWSLKEEKKEVELIEKLKTFTGLIWRLFAVTMATGHHFVFFCMSFFVNRI